MKNKSNKAFDAKSNAPQKLPKNLTDSSGFLASSNKNELLFALMGTICQTENKHDYPWHLELQVETRFNFFNTTELRRELDIQDNIDVELSDFLENSVSTVKVISYLQKGKYHYHWYLSNIALNYDILETLIEVIQIKHQREITFMLSEDPKWQNSTKKLMETKSSMYGFMDYM